MPTSGEQHNNQCSAKTVDGPLSHLPLWISTTRHMLKSNWKKKLLCSTHDSSILFINWASVCPYFLQNCKKTRVCWSSVIKILAQEHSEAEDICSVTINQKEFFSNLQLVLPARYHPSGTTRRSRPFFKGAWNMELLLLTPHLKGKWNFCVPLLPLWSETTLEGLRYIDQSIICRRVLS